MLDHKWEARLIESPRGEFDWLLSCYHCDTTYWISQKEQQEISKYFGPIGYGVQELIDKVRDVFGVVQRIR